MFLKEPGRGRGGGGGGGVRRCGAAVASFLFVSSFELYGVVYVAFIRIRLHVESSRIGQHAHTQTPEKSSPLGKCRGMMSTGGLKVAGKDDIQQEIGLL